MRNAAAVLEPIKEVSRLDRREAKRVAGFEFDGATLAGTAQHNGYRAKLDEINAFALQLRRGR